MLSARQNSLNNKKRQQGVSLLTIALLLLLLGGALMAGISYFRAQIPSEVASSQKEALLWTDKALIGFASIHHRLPCPAATPDGDEDCSIAKGWLPAKALNLDATMYEPGLLPMRYMVYRNPTKSAGTNFSADLAEFDVATARSLPFDSFEPMAWDVDVENDKNEIVDSDAHDGRFVDRYGFDARNGLDMCETMRLAYVQQIHPGASSSYAHYLRGSTVVNVAYGIAAPGLGDASGNNDRFEATNASANPQMEAPDRVHGYNYNDYVFVRDLPSLMSAFGCQPVHYVVSGYHVDDLANGSFGGLTGLVYDTIAPILDIIPDFNVPSELVVEYNREGVAAPMLASVQSVALAVNVIEKVADQYDFVRGNAEEVMAFAIVQAVLSAVAVTVSILSVVADGIGMAKAIAAAIASLGLHAGAWVAIVAYGIALALSIAAIAVNIAGLGMLISGAVKAGLVVSRLGGDESLMEEFCQNIEDNLDEEELQQQMDRAKDELKKERDNAKKAYDRAYEKFKDTEDAVDACYRGLGSVQNQSVTPIIPPSTACTEPTFTYQSCNFSTVRNAYYEFYSYSSLFTPRRDAEVALAEAEEKIKTLDKKINNINNSIANIDDQVDEYKDLLRDTGKYTESEINSAAEKYKNNLLTEYNKQKNEATSERSALNGQLSALRAAVTNAKNNMVNAANALPSSVSNVQVDCTNPSGAATINCNSKYQELCSSSRRLIRSQYFEIEHGGNLFICQLLADDDLFCEDYYYSVWLDYQRKYELYQEAESRFNSFNTDVPNTGADACAPGTDGAVVVWGVDNAKEVLRKVDKRSVLQ